MAKSGNNKPPNDPPGKFDISAGASVVQAELRDFKAKTHQPKDGFSWQRLLGEFPVISEAPYSFVGATLFASAVAIGACWYFGLLVPGVIVTSRDATIATLNSQVNDYKSKLEGATPTEARAELSRLKEQVETLELRTNQKDELITSLKENLVRLETRKVDVLSSITTQNSDKTYKIVREIAVRAYSTPNYLYVTIKSNGLTEANVAGHGGMTLAGQARTGPDTIIVRVTNPVGRFTVTATSATNEADIVYRFE